MKVGPRSAGADPGPACYGRGGTEPTVTDANLALGRLSTKGLAGGELALDAAAARHAIAPKARQLGFSVEKTAQGILGIVVANMVRAVRTISVERGLDPRDYALMPFGGAGPLHAVEVARVLGMGEIVVPAAPGILCAQGLIVSDLKEEFVRSGRFALTADGMRRIGTLLDRLEADARAWFAAEGVAQDDRELTLAFDARYVGQNFELPVSFAGGPDGALARPAQDGSRRRGLSRGARTALRLPQCRRADRDRQHPAYGDRPDCNGWRVRHPRVGGSAGAGGRHPPGLVRRRQRCRDAGPPPRNADTRYGSRRPGHRRAARFHDRRLSRRPGGGRRGREPDHRRRRRKMSPAATPVDPVTLEIMANGLRSVADETFAALMKSAYSTNIKERRDHSTAVMDPAGRLIVQADASLPIHLASMGGLMESLLARFGGELRDGDLFVANDPHVAGGTHLPDINMAMPVFFAGELVAFMCNIAHHADVGGAVPGSMAGGLTEIYQEGLRIPVVRLFREGVLQQDLLDLILLNVRVPTERRGDYFAQIASCRLGRSRLGEIVDQYGVAAVQDGFEQIVRRSADRLRAAVAELPDGVYRFEDVMDDDGMGATDIPIRLAISVKGGDIHFDFSGSAKQVKGNINVTRNATQASVCYALKALLDPDAPNNQGVLDLPRLTVEKGSLLDAAFPAPVAARANTCQRIIDVILGALAPARPEAAVGAANGANTTAVFSGADPRTGEDYVYLEDAGRRLRRPGREGRQGRCAGPYHQHVEPAGRSDRDGISAARPLLRADRRFGRPRPAARRYGP